jgi:hypothetical protein
MWVLESANFIFLMGGLGAFFLNIYDEILMFINVDFRIKNL